MPAPDRIGNVQSFSNVIKPLNGIVGHYSDLEIDALLTSLQVGGGTVDLSDYYTKAEVDQKFVDAATGGTVDLAGYFTKEEGDQLAVRVEYIERKFPNYAPLVSNLDFIAENVTGKTTVSARYLSLLNTIDNSESGCEICVLQKSTGSSDYDLTMKVGNQHHIIAFKDDVADLSGYATTQYVDDTKTEILTAATTAFMERYTKQEVDSLFVKKEDMVAPPGLDGYATEQYVDDSIARIPATDVLKEISGQWIQPKSINVGEGGVVFEDAYRLTVENVGIGPRGVIETSNMGQVTRLVCLTRDDAYTKAEVDAAISAIPATDLSGLAAEINNTQGLLGAFQSVTDNSLSLLNTGIRNLYDNKADEATTYSKTEVDSAIAAAATGSVDLSAYAKITDLNQVLTTKSVIAQGYGFSQTEVLKVHDTNEGYGPRLSYITSSGGDVTIDPVCLKSDVEPLASLLPRMEALESKQAPEEVDLSAYADKATVTQQGQRIEALISEAGIAATERGSQSARITALELGGGSTVDVSGFAKLDDDTQSIVANVVHASRFRFDIDRSVILLLSGGQERPVFRNGSKSNVLAFTSELAAYCTIMDAATQIALCAKKADVYTKEEVEERLLQVPSPMKYLQWGGAFQKVLAGNAKDKWFGAGLIPSIPIIKGKRYRLEMTTKFGPFNTDVKECWVGFRFNYRTLNELPCTKQPLVTMSGWGTTTVTRARAAIAATAVATTTPTRADRFRFNCVDDWTSAEDIIEYAVEFEADQDIANANFVPEICIGGTWLTFPSEFTGIVAVFRQMD